jgi:hypothetical protein
MKNQKQKYYEFRLKKLISMDLSRPSEHQQMHHFKPLSMEPVLPLKAVSLLLAASTYAKCRKFLAQLYYP